MHNLIPVIEEEKLSEAQSEKDKKGNMSPL